MKKIPLFLIMAILFAACEKIPEVVMSDNEDGDATLKSITIVGNDRYVAPSGDISGEADATNITDALNQVKSTGGTVYLTDGKRSTIDQYYVSRNIIVYGFKGVLKGESKQKTIINAGRKNGTVGFKSSISPWWSLLPSGNPDLATVLQLDFPSGDVSIKNLSILIKDDQPTNTQPDYYGVNANYITTFIEILGGEFNTKIENLRLEGKKTSSPGNVEGMNVAHGIHVMLGSPLEPVNKTGVLSVKNIEAKNLAYGVMLFMRYAPGSDIDVDNINATDVGRGINGRNVFDSTVDISNVHASIHQNGYQGMWFWNIPSGLNVSNCTITGSRFFGILLLDIDNAVLSGNLIQNHRGTNNRHYAMGVLFGSGNNTITDNNFKNIENSAGGIRLDSGANSNMLKHNNFKESNLPGWTESSPQGPGAIFLSEATNSNSIHEMSFSSGNGIPLCEMILDLTDDAATAEYDGLNEIHNYQPCENEMAREMFFEELNLESPEFKGSR